MKIVRKAVLAGAFLAVAVAGTWTLTAAEKADAVAEPAKQEASAKLELLPQTCLDTELDAGKSEAMKGGKPKPSACCQPSLQPGFCGNPFCFEGATCCSDGVWRCNQGNGQPVCSSGKICDSGPDPCGEPCGSKGDSCSTGSDCCSGTCGKNDRCR